jgi:protein phosphatase
MTTSKDINSLQAACASDTGLVRKVNQDSCLVDLERHLFIVSDGLGGHLAGEVASKAVVTVLPKLIERRLEGLASTRTRIIELSLREAVLELNQHLQAESAGKPGLQGMGATLSMVMIQMNQRTAHLVNMGDSRIYLYRQGRLSQLTEDHSIAALLIKHGEIDPESARDYPGRSQLSRYIGMGGEVYPDTHSMALQDGDRLLLCSDGLTSMLSDERIQQLLELHLNPEDACWSLTAEAKGAGGLDNVTVLTINWLDVR